MHQAVDDPMERQGGVSFSENRDKKSLNEQRKIGTWLVRVYRRLDYPVIWGLFHETIIRVLIKEPGGNEK